MFGFLVYVLLPLFLISALYSSICCFFLFLNGFFSLHALHVLALCITQSYSICWFIVLFFFLLCITYSYSVQCFLLSFVLLALYFSLEVISSRLTLIYFGCEHINMSDDFSFKSIIFLSNYLFRMFCCLNSFLFNSSFSLNIIPASLLDF